MSGIWIPFVLCWVNDWPWSWVILAWAWIVSWQSGWPLASPTYLASLILVLVVEIGLVFALPTVKISRSVRHTTFAAIVLVWSAVTFGSLPGLALWQLGLGQGAVSRVPAILRYEQRLLMLRAVRFLAGIAVVIILRP